MFFVFQHQELPRDQDVRAGGVFVEGIEKTRVRDLGFCEQREISVLQGRKRLREEECGPQDQRMAFGLILNEIWKSKMEIPINKRKGGSS
jgi:hypothetical protein